MERFDLLIKGASVIDGSGSAPFRADIGVSAGKIAHLDREIKAAGAGKVIQADGLSASPGFIDTHTHDDAYLLINPACDQKVLQGVTTVIIGNCGFSLAPASPDPSRSIERLTLILGGEHLPEDAQSFASLGQYLQALEAAGPGVNVVPLAGHGNIRLAAMGWDDRPPTETEMAEMKNLTAQAMAEGAFGLSTGLIYVPGTYAQTEEIIELARVAAQYQGLYTTHLRSEGDQEMEAIEETLQIGRQAGLPVHIAHHKVVGRQNWGRSTETLKMLEEARAEGLAVSCDQYPYLAGSTYLGAALPPHIQAGGPDLWAEKLKDPQVRRAIIDEINNGHGRWENLIKGAGFESIVMSICPSHQDYLGRSLAEIAQNEGRDPYDLFFDLVIEEKLGAAVIIFMMAEEDVVRIMQNPLTMIGTDGVPGLGSSKVHPRMTSTFPRILGRYVRERGVLALEEAVRKMTSLPAQTFGLKSKGLLKEGFDADIVLFDPKTIIDTATYEDPLRRPEGLGWVIVNGRIAVEEGRVMGGASGKVLRRQDRS